MCSSKSGNVIAHCGQRDPRAHRIGEEERAERISRIRISRVIQDEKMKRKRGGDRMEGGEMEERWKRERERERERSQSARSGSGVVIIAILRTATPSN